MDEDKDDCLQEVVGGVYLFLRLLEMLGEAEQQGTPDVQVTLASLAHTMEALIVAQLRQGEWE